MFEYLNTTSQSGATGSDNSNARLRGGDNYLNNGVYLNGWSYNQTSIGTPFINSVSSTRLLFNNNRVETFYFGILGVINNSISSEIRVSNSRNFGAYTSPFSKIKNQFSGSISLNYSPLFLENIVIKLSVAIDNGELYKDNFGFYLGLKKIL